MTNILNFTLISDHYYFSATGVVTCADVLSNLKVFCGDHTKPAHIRRDVLQLTEKVNMLYTSIQSCIYSYMYTVLGATRRGAPPSITVSDSNSVAGAV